MSSNVSELCVESTNQAGTQHFLQSKGGIFTSDLWQTPVAETRTQRHEINLHSSFMLPRRFLCLDFTKHDH
ncbi:hypothetical protein RRG08_040654 [Elysia crispata]|uniref:Uncharacterized protein n=1 Tax=Elysia crispata TaxID=231223 RepID=A0AAE0YY80_9GAST|nr:hypothetical protein RRG08_040654 [Elysia crispata]